MGLDRLPIPRRKMPLNGGETRKGVGGGDAASNPAGDSDAATAAVPAAAGMDEGVEGKRGVRERKTGASDDKMREVSLASPWNVFILFLSAIGGCLSFFFLFASACVIQLCTILLFAVRIH